MDGKIKEKKKLFEVFISRNEKELSDYSDFIYDLYIKGWLHTAFTGSSTLPKREPFNSYCFAVLVDKLCWIIIWLTIIWGKQE